jgi:hypothetical protein
MAQKKKLDKKLVEKLAGVVLVVDDENGTCYAHERFDSQARAKAFEHGMKTAWKISRGTGRFIIYLLGDVQDFTDWDDAGTPGLEKVIDLL